MINGYMLGDENLLYECYISALAFMRAEIPVIQVPAVKVK